MNSLLPKNWLRMVGMLAALATSTTSHADKIYFVHNDHLGTPQVITDENKRVVWEVDRDPWGNITNVITNTLPNNVSLPGQYDDAETGYSDNWWRTYDSRSGNYLQFDPIGLRGGINPYIYVNASPVMHIDPMGLYVPTNLPQNCKVVPTGGGIIDNSYVIIGQPELIYATGGPVKARGVKGYAIIEFWKQTNTYFTKLIEWMTFYVECKRELECGKTETDIIPGGYDEKIIKDENDVKTNHWVEFDWGTIP